MTQEPNTIIIIGAGVAGLAAGCYAQMNGYHSQIFELHSLPGGLCTSWSRKGYTFDGCIHWLMGSGKSSNFRHIWDELGALDGKQIVDHAEFTRFVDTDGKIFSLFTDPDRLEKHMLDLAPGDAPVIKELVKGIRKVARVDMPAGAPENLHDLFALLKGLPGMPGMLWIMRKYSNVTVHQYCAKLKDPFLRKALTTLFDSADFPMLGLLMMLGYMAAKNAGYPIGGSLKFAQNIEQRYLKLGGEIHYKTRVEKILVENDCAVGIRLVDGSEHRAAVVISAADGHATLFDMLEGKYLTQELRNAYAQKPIFPPIILVSFGLNLNLSDHPQLASYNLAQPMHIAGEEHRQIGVKNYSFDPTLAPEGKSVIEVMYDSNYAYWKKLAEEPERYESEKKDIAIQVMQQLEPHIPGLSQQVEVVDVATPLTFERFTGNWQGSMEGWLFSKEDMPKMARGQELMRKTLSGLANFYQVGQWVEPGGGLPPAATSARGVIRSICKKDSRKFTTTIASKS